MAFTGNLAPWTGYEIVPKQAAKALVAYLTAMRADAPLFDAPMSLPAPAGAPVPTNAATATASAK